MPTMANITVGSVATATQKPIFPKKSSNLLKTLFSRNKYLTAKLSDLQQELLALNFYLKHHCSSDSTQKVLENIPESQHILSKYFTPKSEAMIDMALSTNQIPFRYEQALKLGEATIYPDFTIRHPETDEVYYWEHFGMMDNSSYIKNAHAKLQLYTSHGIIPSINLIITSETSSHPLNAYAIEKNIKHYFR